MNNEKATDVFMAQTEEARALMLAIDAEIDDHMGVDPEAVNWAHVGSMGHVLESLREIARFMGHAE